MVVAHGDLAQRMVRSGHILLGNYEITLTNETTPVTGSYLIRIHHVVELDYMAEMHLGQCFCLWNATSQGVHEQRNYLPPYGIIDSNRVTSRHHSTKGQA
jgi:hypothetical protein